MSSMQKFLVFSNRDQLTQKVAYVPMWLIDCSWLIIGRGYLKHLTFSLMQMVSCSGLLEILPVFNEKQQAGRPESPIQRRNDANSSVKYGHSHRPELCGGSNFPLDPHLCMMRNQTCWSWVQANFICMFAKDIYDSKHAILWSFDRDFSCSASSGDSEGSSQMGFLQSGPVTGL